MSREIDERVVQMRFENGQFEHNVQDSIHSLDELKKGLDFKDASKGLEKIDKASKEISMDPLTASVGLLSEKFNLFGITAFNVLNRISNTAISTGEQLIKSLTIDQISSGWSKYANKTSAVQTIMAATAKQFTDTGEQMNYVNQQLDKLNWFTDETSYNFLDMVNNIGKFTSNNINLETSVTAMQGVANWAAISGANANEASRAMYNLSQAISTGSLKLMDWMSIENANMATAQFKEAAIEAAVSAGTLKRGVDGLTRTLKGNVVSVENFRENLSEAWFTSDVLLSTLELYGGATNKLNELYEATGESTSELISDIDDYVAGIKTADEISKEWDMTLEETKDILDAFSTETMQFGLQAFKAAQEAKTFADVISSVQDAVSTGWMNTFEMFFGDYQEAKKLWTDLANIMYGIFAESGNARNEMLKDWSEKGGRDLFIAGIYNSITALLSVMAPLKSAWRDVFPAMDSDRFLKITEGFQNFTRSLILNKDAMDKVRRTAKGFFAIFSIAKTFISAMENAVLDVTQYLFPFADGILSSTASLGDFLQYLDNLVKETNVFGNAFGLVSDGIKIGCDIIKNAVLILWSTIEGFLSGGETKKFKEAVDPLGVVFEKINFVISVFRSALEKVKASLSSISINFDSVRNAATNFFTVFKNPFSNINFEQSLNILNAGIFGAFILGLKGFTSKLVPAVKDVTGIFGNIKDLFGDLSKALNSFTGSLKSDILLKVAGSIAILAGSILLLSSIDQERLTGGLAAMTTMFGELFATIFGIDKLIAGPKLKKMASISVLFITMSTAVLILAAAVRVLANLEWEKLKNGLTAVAALCAELVLSAKVLSSQSKAVIKGVSGLIAFSVAIRVLVSSVKALSDMDMQSLITGLIGVGAVIAEVIAFMKLSSNSGMKVSNGLGLIALAAAIKILSSVVKSFGEIDTDSMKRGLAGIGAILLELALFSNLTGNAKHILSTAISMNLFASALIVLSTAIERFGSIPIDQLKSSLIAMGVALSEIVLAMNLMPSGVISKGVGLIVISEAINILAKALLELGNMDPAAIGKSLIALAGALIIIVTALIFMKSAISGAFAITVISAALLALAPALRMLGAMSLSDIARSLTALAGTLVIFGVSASVLTPMAPMLLTLAASLMAFGAATLAIGVGVSLLSAGLLALGASSSVGLAGLMSVVEGVIGLIPLFFEQIAIGVAQFAKILSDHSPEILNSLTVLFLSIIQVITDVTPVAVEATLVLLKTLLDKLREHVPDMVTSAMFLLKGFIEGISMNVGDVAAAAIDLVLNFISGVVSKLDDVVNAGFDVIIAFMDGFGNAVNVRAPELIDAFFRMALNIIAGIVKGIWQAGSDAVEAILGVGQKMLDGIKNFFGIRSPSKEMENIGRYIIEGLIKGIKDFASGAVDAVRDAGSKILNGFKDFFGINSPSVVMEEQGKWIVRGIAEGITKDMSAEEAIQKKAENIKKAFESAMETFTLQNKAGNLDYQLWTLTEGKNATDSEKQAKLMETYESDLILLAEKVKNKQGELKALGKIWGEQSNEYLSAENEWKEAKIEMLQKADEINSLQSASIVDERAQMKAYADMMKEYAETFKMLGKSDEELSAFAREKTGYGIEKTDSTIIDTASIVNDALSDIDVSIEDAVKNTVSKAITKGAKAAVPAAEDAGENVSLGFSNGASKQTDSVVKSASDLAFTYLEYLTNKDGLDENSPSRKTMQIGEYAAQGFIDGVNSAIPNAEDSAIKLSESFLNEFQKKIPQFEYIARMAMEGFTRGITEGGQKAIAAAQVISDEVATAMRRALDIASPSKVTRDIGRFVGEGLALGILDKAPMVDQSSEDMANNALSGLDDIRSRISDVLANDDDFSPIITPVLDLDVVKQQAASIPGMFGNSSGLSVRTSLNRANSISSNRNLIGQNGSNKDSVTQTNYNFTQNNYSPKALNRTEIYRQTKNQFSQLKGAIKR